MPVRDMLLLGYAAPAGSHEHDVKAYDVLAPLNFDMGRANG